MVTYGASQPAKVKEQKEKTKTETAKKAAKGDKIKEEKDNG